LADYGSLLTPLSHPCAAIGLAAIGPDFTWRGYGTACSSSPLSCQRGWPSTVLSHDILTRLAGIDVNGNFDDIEKLTKEELVERYGHPDDARKISTMLDGLNARVRHYSFPPFFLFC